jgi:hypothetical protein
MGKQTIRCLQAAVGVGDDPPGGGRVRGPPGWLENLRAGGRRGGERNLDRGGWGEQTGRRRGDGAPASRLAVGGPLRCWW